MTLSMSMQGFIFITFALFNYKSIFVHYILIMLVPFPTFPRFSLPLSLHIYQILSLKNKNKSK